MNDKEGKSKKMQVSFNVEIVPKNDFSDDTRAEVKKPEQGVFAIQELQVGSEDFVVVMGRTHVAYK